MALPGIWTRLSPAPVHCGAIAMTSTSQKRTQQQPSTWQLAPSPNRRVSIARPRGDPGLTARDCFGPDAQRWRAPGFQALWSDLRRALGREPAEPF